MIDHGLKIALLAITENLFNFMKCDLILKLQLIFHFQILFKRADEQASIAPESPLNFFGIGKVWLAKLS